MLSATPVIMAYSVITRDEAYIYTDKDRFDDKTLAKFRGGMWRCFFMTAYMKTLPE